MVYESLVRNSRIRISLISLATQFSLGPAFDLGGSDQILSFGSREILEPLRVRFVGKLEGEISNIFLTKPEGVNGITEG